MQDQPIPRGLCQCGCGRKTRLVPKSCRSKGLVKGEPFRYIHGHQRRKPGPDYRVDPSTGCWVWLRYTTQSGYGSLCIDGKQHAAHRVYYERLIGPIPDGLVIDHLCRNRACVNPAHMEPVTNVENVLRGYSVPAIKARQTHCKRGHELSGDNVWVSDKGHRDCRACHRIDQREWKRRHALNRKDG